MPSLGQGVLCLFAKYRDAFCRRILLLGEAQQIERQTRFMDIPQIGAHPIRIRQMCQMTEYGPRHEGVFTDPENGQPVQLLCCLASNRCM